MRGTNLTTKQRRSAISATVVLTAVMLLFVGGLFLMIKLLMTNHNTGDALNTSAFQDLQSMARTHEHIQAARQSTNAPAAPAVPVAPVVPALPLDDAARRQKAAEVGEGDAQGEGWLGEGDVQGKGWVGEGDAQRRGHMTQGGVI